MITLPGCLSQQRSHWNTHTHMQTCVPCVCVHTLNCEGFVNATEWMVKADHYEEEEEGGSRKRSHGITRDEVSLKVRKVVK